MGFPIRLAIMLALSFSVGFFAFRWASEAVRNAPPQVEPAEFLAEVERGTVRDIIVDDDWQGLIATSSERGRFWVTLRVERPLALQWRSRGISVKVERRSVSP